MTKLTFHPLTPDRWDDLVDLFGPEVGANSGCWCMWWRMTRPEWKTVPREEKRDRFRAVVEAGPPPGVLAYEGESAIGWCAVGPRASLPRFNHSRVAAPVDEMEGVFAINCFFIRSRWRGQHVMRALLAGALDFASSQGARIVEACPIDVERKLFWGEGFVGIASVFRDAGFEEIARRTPARPLMRKALKRKLARRSKASPLPA